MSEVEQSVAGGLYRVYCRFMSEVHEVALPKWADLADKGKAWFAVARAVDEAKQPQELAAPTTVEIVDEIARLTKGDGTPLKETLPTHLTIRPILAGDMTAGDMAEGWDESESAVQAHVFGVTQRMLEFRLTLADADAAGRALNSVQPVQAATLLVVAFVHAGGVRIEGDGGAWGAVAWCAMATEMDTHELVVLRTPGWGTVKVGPVRRGHLRIYESVEGEWSARIAALAKLLNRDPTEIKALTAEDLNRVWLSVERLKKKSEMIGLSRFGAARSTPPTTGPEKKSTN